VQQRTAAAEAAPRPQRRILVALVMVITLGPICIDMYLPALPELARHFNTDVRVVQLTLSVYMMGFAVSHLFYGSAADHFGRRPVLTGGLLIFLASTVGCALAESLPVLILFRFLQALGASSFLIIPRAIVRDLYGPSEMARILSYMATAMAVAPMLAPLAGGYLTTWFSWHAVFWAIAIYGLIVLGAFRFWVPESVPKRGDAGFDFGTLIRNKTALLADRRFTGLLCTITFVSCGMFAYVSGSAFVLIEHLHVRTDHFGYYYAVPVFGFIAGNTFNARMHGAISGRRVITVGLGVIFTGSLVMLGLALFRVANPFAVVGPQFLYMLGMALVLPHSFAAAMGPYPHMAATASALMGFVQVTSSAILVTVLGNFQQYGQILMGGTMSATSLLAALSFWLLVINRPRT
jgi:DHA1 family bicyclomycin/chloramphenicol resistance-like MFS transporter